MTEDICNRPGDNRTVLLKDVVESEKIIIGEHTTYHDPIKDPKRFEKNNVLCQENEGTGRLMIGKFTSVAFGVKFLFDGEEVRFGNFSINPDPYLPAEWTEETRVKGGDIIIGNDVSIGYDSVILSGVTIGDGAVIRPRSVITEDIPPYTVAGGSPAKIISPRFDEKKRKKLQDLRWWDWKEEKIKRCMDAIRSGDVDAVEKAS